MNPQTPPPAPRGRGISSLQITAVVVAVLVVILAVVNIGSGKTVLWFFGLGLGQRLNGIPIQGVLIPTGFVVLISLVIGGVLGYFIARGPRRR